MNKSNLLFQQLPFWTSKGIKKIDLVVTNGKIISCDAQNATAQHKKIDISTLVAMPLAVDLSFRTNKLGGRITVHNLNVETKAALSRGIGYVCLSPDTTPVIDVPSHVILLKNTKPDAADTFPIASMTNRLEGQEMADFGALLSSGAIGFSNGNHQFTNKQILLNIFEYSSTKDIQLFYHPIDRHMSQGSAHKGYIADLMGIDGITKLSETLELETILQMIKNTNAKVHICRVSCLESVALIRQAKAEGLQVTADVDISHLWLDETALKNFNVLAKTFPVLRAEEDRLALIEGVKDGTMDAIVSSHIPVKEYEKNLPFSEATFGVSTLDSHVALCLKLASENIIDWQTIMNAMIFNPAKFIKLDIESLFGQDLMIWDTNESWVLEEHAIKSSSKYNYFIDSKFPCQAKHIFKDGVEITI